jgi:4-hydroxybenzoate polyprenyltransferase
VNGPPLSRPLLVMLDGVLVRSGLLWECLLAFLKQDLRRIWMLPLWLLRDRARFARRLYAAAAIDAATLPYDRALLARLAAERASGRRIVLAAGASPPFARRVAAHLGLFDLVLAEAPDRPAGAHDYDIVDAAHAATGRRGGALVLLRAVRPRQWLKNLLVFVPMLAGHELGLPALAASAVAFAAFSLCASSAYLLNDSLDAHDDRLHPTKHARPIASGALGIPLALCASLALALAGLGLALLFHPVLAAAAGLYFVSTLAYSTWMKRLMMVDIIALAILYSLRVLGGSAATGIAPSFWLIAFSFFLFLSLALLKRYSELFNLKRAGRERTRGRGYTTADKAAVGIMGINSAFLSVLIVLLYFNSSNVIALYPHRTWLLAILPLLVLWLGRLWILAYRGKVNEDPVLYVSTDRTSLVVFALCLACAVAAAR